MHTPYWNIIQKGFSKLLHSKHRRIEKDFAGNIDNLVREFGKEGLRNGEEFKSRADNCIWKVLTVEKGRVEANL